MTTAKAQEFADRVKDLREKKAISQTDLARAAGLAPAALSRLLTGERRLKMDHVVVLARALGTTAIELTHGTTAEEITREWVPRSEFDGADAARSDAERELEICRADLAARSAERDSLREAISALTEKTSELERALARATADAARAEQLSEERNNLKRTVHDLQGQVANLRASADSFRAQAAAAQALANRNYQAWHEAKSRVASLEAGLASAQGEKVAVGVITAALAGIAGAILAAPAETPRTSRRRG